MNIQLFLDTLPIMLKGMVGIFAVTGVLVCAILVLRSISKKRDEGNNA